MKISPAQVYARAIQRIEASSQGHSAVARHSRAHRGSPAGLVAGIEAARLPDRPCGSGDRRTCPRPRPIRASGLFIRTGSGRPAPVFADADTHPELPAPSPASFGFADPADIRSLVRDVAPRMHVARAPGQVPLPPVPIWPRQSDAPAAVSSSFARPLLPVPSPQTFGLPANAAGTAAAQGGRACGRCSIRRCSTTWCPSQTRPPSISAA